LRVLDMSMAARLLLPCQGLRDGRGEERERRERERGRKGERRGERKGERVRQGREREMGGGRETWSMPMPSKPTKAFSPISATPLIIRCHKYCARFPVLYKKEMYMKSIVK